VNGCGTSQTRPRRAIIHAFPTRPPRTWATRAALLHLARLTAGFAEWVQVRAGTAATELETTEETP
jgi:hypothetical protein